MKNPEASIRTPEIQAPLLQKRYKESAAKRGLNRSSKYHPRKAWEREIHPESTCDVLMSVIIPTHGKAG